MRPTLPNGIMLKVEPALPDWEDTSPSLPHATQPHVNTSSASPMLAWPLEPLLS